MQLLLDLFVKVRFQLLDVPVFEATPDVLVEVDVLVLGLLHHQQRAHDQVVHRVHTRTHNRLWHQCSKVVACKCSILDP